MIQPTDSAADIVTFRRLARETGVPARGWQQSAREHGIPLFDLGGTPAMRRSDVPALIDKCRAWSAAEKGERVERALAAVEQQAGLPPRKRRGKAVTA